MLGTTEVTSLDWVTVPPPPVAVMLVAATAAIETPAVGQSVMVDGTAVMIAGFCGTLAAHMPVK